MNLIDNIDDYYNPKYSEQEYDDACKYKDKLLEDIDKRFIDREELKKDIITIFTHYDMEGNKIELSKKEKLVLKLLESKDK